MNNPKEILKKETPEEYRGRHKKMREAAMLCVVGAAILIALQDLITSRTSLKLLGQIFSAILSFACLLGSIFLILVAGRKNR